MTWKARIGDVDVGERQVNAIESLTNWSTVIDDLETAWAVEGPAAQKRADEYAAAYEHRRASMVFDVVMSAQRRYSQRVLPLVGKFEEGNDPASLSDLATRGPVGDFPFRSYEKAALRETAARLWKFCLDRGVGPDDGVRQWASESGFGHSYRLDPWVGRVNGIGLALHCYLRMRSGATDTVKPDGRLMAWVAAKLGLGRLRDAHLTLDVGWAAAKALGISPLAIDQLVVSD